MKRLTIFAKGNSDVAESLFFCPDPVEPWNGINEALRTRQRSRRARIRHETFTRSDALLLAGKTPSALRLLDLAPPYDLTSQFSPELFEGTADVYALSIQSDVTMTLMRHRGSGHLFYAHAFEQLPRQTQHWVRAECEAVPLLRPEMSLQNFLAVVSRIRQRTDAPILVYNMSSVVPGDSVDDYSGLPETLATRIKRFNLALVELSARSGVIVVDVDRLTARYGADHLKLDGVRLNARGNRLIAEEVVRILTGQGCLDD